MKTHASNQFKVKAAVSEAKNIKLNGNRAAYIKDKTASLDQPIVELGSISDQTSLAHRANWVTKLLEI